MNVDEIIEKLWSIENQPIGSHAPITGDEIKYLCKEVRKIFIDQPTLLDLCAPMTICGDIHGQYHDMLRIFRLWGLPPTQNYLFLGDYVDRGQNNIETVCLGFAYKIKYPENFFMLRGNHESASINRYFGFFDECESRFDERLWDIFCDVFNCLPLCALIEDKVFCVHGGISPYINSLDQIRQIQRPCEIPEEGIMCDLLWSDPDTNATEWEDNERGTSFAFGSKCLSDFLEKFDLKLVVRGHQAVMCGYDFTFPDIRGIVTVFSAPNYCYKFMNKGGILHLDSNMNPSFSVLQPIDVEEDYFIGPRPGTPPVDE
jgi:serine/threonine-protein phosphatase PP1 catalytic subunit